MCIGLVGIMGVALEQIKRMASAIHHRGPDDYGEFIDIYKEKILSYETAFDYRFKKWLTAIFK